MILSSSDKYIMNCLQPYFNLGAVEGDKGPIHALSLVKLGQNLLHHAHVSAIPHQLNTLSVFRSMLHELYPQDVVIQSPHELPESLRTDAWQRLCDLLDRWDNLNAVEKDNTVLVLCRLGFYQTVLDYVDPIEDQEIAKDPTMARLARRYANALGKRVNRQVSIDLYKKIVRLTPVESPERFAAITQLIVYYSKQNEIAQVQEWCELGDHALHYRTPAVDPVETLLVSMYYRASSFLPFLKGDRAETVRILDLAMELGQQIPAEDTRYQQMYRENMFPLLETRAREAKWLGDTELAFERTRRLVEHDPYDPKTHLRLGKLLLEQNRIVEALASYRHSAELGFPLTPLAWFMTGQCYELLQEPEAALQAYQNSVQFSPTGGGQAALKRIAFLAKSLNKPETYFFL
ncbi:hypothetical protein CIG75_15140 [Tumebacillus algifaecis]|uniref:Uncharacterized protein n=1 Tax=Tumebacillus algifaecis TaxID=1214604 RepID=A0A223D3S3_9BACL|nr:hypothetical protein CIG75_15140 [Tumebacillus algifaecis]